MESPRQLEVARPAAWLARRRRRLHGRGHRRDRRRGSRRRSRDRSFSRRRRLEVVGRRILFAETIEIAEVVDRWRRGSGGRIRVRGCCGFRRRLRRRLDGCGGRLGRGCRPLGSYAASNEDAAQEDDDRHHGRCHEQKHQLFPIQLNLMEAVVRCIRGQIAAILALCQREYQPIPAALRSQPGSITTVIVQPGSPAARHDVISIFAGRLKSANRRTNAAA